MGTAVALVGDQAVHAHQPLLVQDGDKTLHTGAEPIGVAVFAAGVGGEIIGVAAGDQFLEDGPHGIEIGFQCGTDFYLFQSSSKTMTGCLIVMYFGRQV